LVSRALSSTRVALSHLSRLPSDAGHSLAKVGLTRRLLTPRTGVFVLAALALVAIMAGTKSWSNVAYMYRDRFEGTSTIGPHEDYVAFYAAGRMVREGHGGSLYDVDAIGLVERESMGRFVGGTGVLAFFNPPFVAAAFAPLSALPIRVAAAVVGVIGAALVLGAGLGMQRLLGLREAWQRVAFWLAYLSLYSVSWVVLHGQLSMLLLLGWLFFIVLQIKGRQEWSGAALALLLVKPQMAVLPVIVLLWKRQWRALAVFAAIAYVLVAVSLLVAGPKIIIDYPRFLIESAGWDHKFGITTDRMLGWNGFVASFLESNSIGHLGLTWILSGATALAALFMFRGRWEPQEPRFLFQCGVLVVAGLLASPHLYLQDLSLMALALTLVLAYALRSNRAVLPWLAVAAGVWASQEWGPWLLDSHGVNLLTPVMALTLVGFMLPQRQREFVVEAVAPRPQLTGGIQALYLLQACYLAFIVSFSIVRGGLVLPDVVLVMLVAGFVWGRQRMVFVRDFAPFVLLLFSYDAMRGMVADLNTAHFGYPITLEKALFFGHVPTADLQRWFADVGVTHWYDSLASAVYALHFVVPLIFAAVIWQYRRDYYWRFMITLLLISYAAFVTFMLIPTAPPWLAGFAGHLPDVRMVHNEPYSAFIYNKVSPNPVAAMPSLHAAYPWLFFLFGLRLWGKRALPMVLYPTAVTLAVVYLGHHYVVDVIGGFIYASIGYWLVCGPVGEYVAKRASASVAKEAESPALAMADDRER
jgi:membrane-associated phospholipid phosphatase